LSKRPISSLFRHGTACRAPKAALVFWYLAQCADILSNRRFHPYILQQYNAMYLFFHSLLCQKQGYLANTYKRTTIRHVCQLYNYFQVIEPWEVHRLGVSSPHTVHCLPTGDVLISTLGRHIGLFLGALFPTSVVEGLNKNSVCTYVSTLSSENSGKGNA
jgi:hypothetical protein